jgi:hypothetical protein
MPVVPDIASDRTRREINTSDIIRDQKVSAGWHCLGSNTQDARSGFTTAQSSIQKTNQQTRSQQWAPSSTAQLELGRTGDGRVADRLELRCSASWSKDPVLLLGY